MDLVDAITHLQERLAALNMGNRLVWSLDDCSAVSLVCIILQQQTNNPVVTIMPDNVRANYIFNGNNILDTSTE
jgi:hypothetical protein